MRAIDIMEVMEVIGESCCIFDSPELQVVLLCLKPGQGIEPHLSTSEVVLLALEGKGVFSMGEEDYEAKPGSLLVIPCRVVRGLVATTPMRILMVVTKTSSLEGVKH